MGSDNEQKDWQRNTRRETQEIEVDLARFRIKPVLINSQLKTVVLSFSDYWMLSDRR